MNVPQLLGDKATIGLRKYENDQCYSLDLGSYFL